MLIPLGPFSSVTPGTLVQVTSNVQLRSQSLLFQAFSNASHTNTGRVYLLSGNSAATAVRFATLAVPTTNTIPSCSVTIPDSPASLSLTRFFIDADNATDGCDVSYAGP